MAPEILPKMGYNLKLIYNENIPNNLFHYLTKNTLESIMIIMESMFSFFF